MRNETQMIDAILDFAKRNERIRAVIMNGSRVNPEAPRDLFQDYDIVYVVTDLDSFVTERSWIQTFGEVLIMQTPDEMGASVQELYISFHFLILFQDGNRIDFTFHRLDRLQDLESDSLSLVLLDKDGIVAPMDPPSNTDYLPLPPTRKQYDNCCNEFWWVATYIAKGLWRKELAYAKFMFERPVRDMLNQMIKWYIGVQTDFAKDPGKCGKYFERYLQPITWDRYVKTFPNGDYKEIWQALFVMCDLFRELACEVGKHYQYEYPIQDDTNVMNYLNHVRELPQHADRIFS